MQIRLHMYTIKRVEGIEAYTVNFDADDLAMNGARAVADRVLVYFSQMNVTRIEKGQQYLLVLNLKSHEITNRTGIFLQ